MSQLRLVDLLVAKEEEEAMLQVTETPGIAAALEIQEGADKDVAVNDEPTGE